MITPDTRPPLISVYIPTRNRPSLLDRAVRSVLGQDYQSLEIIIVDDASDQAVYNKWNDDRIRVFNNREPAGAPASRNLAIVSARGEFITGLDDDDMFLSNRISSFLAFWRRIQPFAEILPVAGLFDSSLVVRRRGALPVIRFTEKIVDFQALLCMSVIGNQVFIPTSRMQDVGGFSLKMPMWQDHELWCRLSQRYGPFLNIASSTMIVDESHPCHRISSASHHNIRLALEHFSSQFHLSSPKQLSHPLVFALHYVEFKPQHTDVMTLILARRYRQALRMFVRFFHSRLSGR